MLDDQLKTQLSAYLERVQQPFELVASLNDSDTSREMLELLQTIQSLRSDKITLRTDSVMRSPHAKEYNAATRLYGLVECSTRSTRSKATSTSRST